MKTFIYYLIGKLVDYESKARFEILLGPEHKIQYKIILTFVKLKLNR